MRTLALITLLACAVSFADPPAPGAREDAPIKVELQPGEPAPALGCFIDKATCIATGQQIADLKADRAGLQAANESLRKSIADFPSPVLYVAGGLVVGLLVGYAAARATLTR
jgi:hypothetical protein